MNCVGNDHYIDCFHGFMPSVDRIVNALRLGTSKLRIIFCDWAFGVGTDFKNFSHFTHINAPWSMEEYLQEAGRVGRDDLPSCQ